MHATTSHAHSASMSAAADTLDAELEWAAGDDHFALILRACIRGGRATLDSFCDHVGDPAEKAGRATSMRCSKSPDWRWRSMTAPMSTCRTSAR